VTCWHKKRPAVLVASPPFFGAALPLVTALAMSTSSGCPPTTGYNTVPAVEDHTWGGRKQGGSTRLPLPLSRGGMKRESMLVSASRGEQLAKNRLPLGAPETRHPSGPARRFRRWRWREGIGDRDPVGLFSRVHSREEWMLAACATGLGGDDRWRQWVAMSFLHVFFNASHFAYSFGFGAWGPRAGPPWS